MRRRLCAPGWGRHQTEVADERRLFRGLWGEQATLLPQSAFGRLGPVVVRDVGPLSLASGDRPTELSPATNSNAGSGLWSDRLNALDLGSRRCCHGGLMLGYRSYFSVAGAEAGQTIPLALGQLHAWLRSKKYDADLLVPGESVELGYRALARLTTERTQDGGESIRFVLREAQPIGTWTTQLVIHDPRQGREQPWVWLDVDAPPDEGSDGRRPRWTPLPRLARELLEVLDGRDHGARLNPSVETVREEDVDSLIEVLAAPGRRGPVFVAGSDPTLPMDPWRKLVGELLRQTTGLAAGYILDPAATARFEDAVGARHAVPPGAMRTYLRGMDIGSDLDAYRHRLLTTGRIVSDDPSRVVRVLGNRARDLTLNEPLPRAASRTLERLLALAEEAPISLLPAAQEVVDGSAPADQTLTKPAGDDATTGPPGAVSATSAAADSVEEHLALAAQVRQIFGDEAVTSDSLARWAADVVEGERLRAVLERRDRQLAEAGETALMLSDELAVAVHRLEDEQLEHRSTFDVLTIAENERHALRMRLQAADLGDEAWMPLTGEEAAAAPPETFGDVLKRVDALKHVVFTGDAASSEELDVRDPLGTWAAKAWSALCALEDYVQSRLDGQHTGSVDMYLGDVPTGCRGYSANRHARDESEDVRTNSKFRAAREFKVPEVVAASGIVFMGAHFKIAQSGTISPRLHYVDAFDVNETVYVGYIGRHLPTQKTN